MRSLPLYGVGMFFLLVAAGFLALSWRRSRPATGPATKAQQREDAVAREETRKLRIAAGVTAGLGVLLILIS